MNNPYGNPNDTIPLLVEGGMDRNTVSVIKSSGFKYDKNDVLTTEPTEAELRFDYEYSDDNSFMNAAIYTLGNDHILRLKPLEPLIAAEKEGTETRLIQEVQIEGANVGDTIVRIAAEGNQNARLVFAKEDPANPKKDAIDIAQIYRPANFDYLKVEPGEKLEVEGNILLPKTPVDPDYAPSYELKFTDSYYDEGDSWEVVEETYTLRSSSAHLQIFHTSDYIYDPHDNELLAQINSFGSLWIKGYLSAIKVYEYSDINLKKNILPIDSPLDKILSIEGVSFEWEEEYADKDSPEERQYGVIAQDIEKILPEIIKEDADGIKAVSYTSIIPLLIEAIKEQQRQIEALKKVIGVVDIN